MTLIDKLGGVTKYPSHTIDIWYPNLIEEEGATMTQTQHTPGQWLIKYDKEMYVMAGELRIAKIPTLHKHGNRQASDFDEENANAHLIAAAPDMLEALEVVYSDIELQNVKGGSDELNFMVQQAINKARGEK